MGKNPKVLTVLPVETSNLQIGDARQKLEKIDSALLPANVTKCMSPNKKKIPCLYASSYCQFYWNQRAFSSVCTSQRKIAIDLVQPSVFERFDIELSFWSGEPLSPRPILQNFCFFLRYRRFVVVVVTTGYYWGLLQKDLLWKGMIAFLWAKDF